MIYAGQANLPDTFLLLPGGAMTASVSTGGNGINASDAALVDAIVE